MIVALSLTATGLAVWMILSLTADRSAAAQDTAEERQARIALYELFNLAGHATYRDAVNFSNDVHSRLGAGDGFDPKQVIGGLLKKYGEADYMASFTQLQNATPPNGTAVAFKELLRRFERAYCSYEKLLFWTQHSALLIPISPDSDKAYQQWLRTDREFQRRFREAVAKQGLAYLRGQTEGCRNSFRLTQVPA